VAHRGGATVAPRLKRYGKSTRKSMVGGVDAKGPYHSQPGRRKCQEFPNPRSVSVSTQRHWRRSSKRPPARGCVRKGVPNRATAHTPWVPTALSTPPPRSAVCSTGHTTGAPSPRLSWWAEALLVSQALAVCAAKGQRVVRAEQSGRRLRASHAPEGVQHDASLRPALEVCAAVGFVQVGAHAGLLLLIDLPHKPVHRAPRARDQTPEGILNG